MRYSFLAPNLISFVISVSQELFFLHKEQYNGIIRSTCSQFISIMSNLVNASEQDNGGSNGISFLIHQTKTGFSLW